MSIKSDTAPHPIVRDQTAECVLEARSITKTYSRGGFFKKAEEVAVLHGVDLAIRAGECVGLIGRSGSGKSTLGRILLGLETPTSGEACILGRRTTDEKGRVRLDRDQRRAVQVVFQDALGSVNPRLTAGDIIAEPLRNFENLKGAQLTERVAELLVHVGLSPEDAVKHPARFQRRPAPTYLHRPRPGPSPALHHPGRSTVQPGHARPGQNPGPPGSPAPGR